MNSNPQYHEIPSYMRSHNDPRVLAENLDPERFPTLPTSSYEAAWTMLEQAFYWPLTPQEKQERISQSRELFEETAELEHVPQAVHYAFSARLALASMPLFEKRLNGFETITSEDIMEVCDRTAPILRDIVARHSIETAGTRGMVRGVLGEGLAYWFAAYAADETRIPFLSSVREDVSHRNLGNNDFYQIVDDSIKLPTQVKFSIHKAREEKPHKGVGLLAIGYQIQKVTQIQDEDRALDYITDLMCRVTTNGDVTKAEYGILDHLTDIVLESGAQIKPEVVDSDGNLLPWRPNAERYDQKDADERTNAIAALKHFLINRTQVHDSVVGVTRQAIPIFDVIGRYAAFDKAEVEQDFSVSPQQENELSDIANRYLAEVSLAIEPTTPVRRLRLSLRGEVICDYELAPGDIVTNNKEPISTKHLTHIMKRLVKEAHKIKWQPVADHS